MDFKVLTIALFLTSVSLTGCGGGGSGSDSTQYDVTDNANDNPANDDNSTDGDNSTDDQSGDNEEDSPVILADTTWSAGADRILGVGFNGDSSTPEITMMKGTPVLEQDGDIFSIRSATYPNTELSEIKSIDNLMDRRDFQDIEIMVHNNESYVVACQDGSDTTGFTSAASLHIFKVSDPAKVAERDLITGNFEARECSGISAEFTQGTNDAMSAVVYYAGDTMQTSGSPLIRYARILKAALTIDTTVDVDAGGAVVMNSLDTIVRGDVVDEFMGVASFGDHVYYAYYDDSEGTNNLGYANTGVSPVTTRNVSFSASDPFVTGVAQQMLVKDMFVVPGQTTTDFDHIYMVSDSDASGVVVAGFRRDINVKRSMILSTDTATEHCSDVITGVSDQGVGQKLWCHDATDGGNIMEASSPVYPAQG